MLQEATPIHALSLWKIIREDGQALTSASARTISGVCSGMLQSVGSTHAGTRCDAPCLPRSYLHICAKVYALICFLAMSHDTGRMRDFLFHAATLVSCACTIIIRFQKSFAECHTSLLHLASAPTHSRMRAPRFTILLRHCTSAVVMCFTYIYKVHHFDRPHDFFNVGFISVFSCRAVPRWNAPTDGKTWGCLRPPRARLSKRKHTFAKQMQHFKS